MFKLNKNNQKEVQEIANNNVADKTKLRQQTYNKFTI